MRKKANNNRRLGAGLMLAAVIFAPLLLMTGCAKLTGNYVNSNKNIKAAIKYLNERYDTEFDYLEDKPYAVGSGNVFGAHGNSVHMYVTCKDLPGKKILVVGEEGSGTFSCNYTAMKYEDEAYAVLDGIAKSVYGDSAKVFWEGHNGDRLGDLEKDAALDDFLRSGHLDFITVLTDKNDDMMGDYRRFINALIERGVECVPETYHYSEAALYADTDKLAYRTDLTNEQKIGRCMTSVVKDLLGGDFNFDTDTQFQETFL